MIQPMKNVIVIGATGLVGLELIKQLSEIEHCEKIVAVVRKENSRLNKIKKVQQVIIQDFFFLNDQDVDGFSHAFSCLGTTLKKAGSKENFYKTDFEVNAHFVDLFELKETHYILVSSMGANMNSSIFYSRVKGELEQHVVQSKLYKTSIIRPSLLLGDRGEQRIFEGLSQKIYQKISKFMPKTFKYKPVTAQQVAHTMVVVAQSQQDKLKIYDNLQIQKIN